jgi:hypothetical protein
MRCHSPRCRIVFEVRDRVPVCASLDLSSSENGSFFRAKHLAAIKLDDLRDDVYAAAGVLSEIRRAVTCVRLVIRPFDGIVSAWKLSPEFLSQVAEVYNGAPVGGRIAAIKAAFVVSDRQALRYKKQVEEMRLLHD